MHAPRPESRRWLMWAIPSLLFLIGFFHRVAPGVIAKELMQSFDATGALVGLLSATYFYGYAGFMIPGGLVIDALGVRRVVGVGGVLMALGTLAMGLAAGQGLLFAGRLAVGLGSAVTFVGALKIAAVWFPPSQFATLSAVTATMGVLGGLVATAPLALLVAGAGWRGAFALIGLATLGLALVNLWLVRDRPPGASLTHGAPGLADVLAGTLSVLRNPHTWPPFVTFFFLYSAAGNLMLWAVPYLRDVYGLATAPAAAYASATSLALLAAAPLTGWLSDRVVRRRKLPYTLLASAQLVLYIVLTVTAGRLPLAGVFALLFAMGVVGGAFVLTWPIGREVNPPALAGIAVAVVNFGGFLGAALTQGPVGAVLDARWAGAMSAGARVYPVDAYRGAFAVCAVFALAAALATLLVKETYGRNVSAELGAGRKRVGTAGPA